MAAATYDLFVSYPTSSAEERAAARNLARDLGLLPLALDVAGAAAQAGPPAMPSDLVARTLALVDGLDGDSAADRAALAFRQCEVRSLSEPRAANGQTAHRVRSPRDRSHTPPSPSSLRRS